MDLQSSQPSDLEFQKIHNNMYFVTYLKAFKYNGVAKAVGKFDVCLNNESS